MDLTNDELSKKCLYRKTQNSNDSINNVIWKSWPKYIYVGRIVLEIGIDDWPFTKVSVYTLQTFLNNNL